MSFFEKFFVRPPELHGLPAGQAGEEWVAYLYRQNGHRVIARNYAIYGQKKLGEIDIVCQKNRRLILVEVKTRADERFMGVEEAVDLRKQNYLRRMAKLFLLAHPQYRDYDLQIDVAAVLLDPFDNQVKSVRLIENAIEDSE